ncbi:SRPBCC family protein [Chloroflexota bacterium]
MFDREYSTVIKCPVGEVLAYVTDPARVPEWTPMIDEVRVDPPGPLGVGSKISQTYRGREEVWQVTAYEPDSYSKYETEYWNTEEEVTYRVEPVEDGTRFTIHDRGDRRGLVRLIGPVLDRYYIHHRKRQLAIIKEALEGGGAAGE